MARLVDATIESLLTVGYSGTTVKEICGRAELSHGALFRFFPSVLDLVIAASEEVGRRQIAEFEEKLPALLHPKRRGGAARSGSPLIAALVVLRDVCRSPINKVFYELLVAARTDVTLRDALRPSMERYYDAISATARRVPGTEAFSDEVLGSLLFTVIHLFDGEALSRVVLPQPEHEARRMALLETLVESLEAPVKRP